MDGAANAVARHDYLPFGEELAGSMRVSNGYGTATKTKQKFTSKQRDDETGLDFFEARHYSSVQGRFTTPDEFTGGAVDPSTGKQVQHPGPLPYADIRLPQSLNKYAYVLNNPLRYTDPDGHCIWDLCVGEGVALYAAGAFVVGTAAYMMTPQGKEGLKQVIVGTSAAVSEFVYRVSAGTKAKIDESAGGKCEYCGVDVVKPKKSEKDVSPPPNERQTDHYEPKAAGGTDDPSNLVNSCRTCNREKSDTKPEGTKFELPRMRPAPPPKPVKVPTKPK